MHPKTAGVNDSFGDTLMVEVENLFAKVKVFEPGGAACSDLEGILVIGYRDALLRGQHGGIAIGGLVHFSATADLHVLIGVPHIFSVIGNALSLVIVPTFLRHIYLPGLVFFGL
jgi:hypothetical protein